MKAAANRVFPTLLPTPQPLPHRHSPGASEEGTPEMTFASRATCLQRPCFWGEGAPSSPGALLPSPRGWQHGELSRGHGGGGTVSRRPAGRGLPLLRDWATGLGHGTGPRVRGGPGDRCPPAASGLISQAQREPRRLGREWPRPGAKGQADTPPGAGGGSWRGPLNAGDPHGWARPILPQGVTFWAGNQHSCGRSASPCGE